MQALVRRPGKAPDRKKGVHDRFSLTNDQFRVARRRIHIPHLGWVRMREALRLWGKLMSATISRPADRWFVSLAVQTEAVPRRPKEHLDTVGVDLGVLTLATLSTGERIPGPEPLQQRLGRLRRLSRSLSRPPKPKGSKNRAKAKAKLAFTLGSPTSGWTVCTSSRRTSRAASMSWASSAYVQGMVRNRHRSRAIADMGLHEFRRQLATERREATVVVADRFLPSSNLCSAGGVIEDDLPLSSTWPDTP